MSVTLAHLISEAARLAGDGPCAAGHTWLSGGARRCPKDIRADCGQTVYRCAKCGEYDFGEPGGPGHFDCGVHYPGEDADYIADDVYENKWGD